MLNKAKALKNFKLNCIDGEIGKVKDFYFEDQTWFVKYLVVNTGNWLFERQVLISPSSIVSINSKEEYITTNLTKQQIENSPLLESDKPVSMQFQEDFYGYYGLPIYASELGNGSGGSESVVPYQKQNGMEDKIASDENNGDPHLRSTYNVSGYNIQAMDDKIGHVDDFIIDDENWKIQYMEIDTKNWLPGRKILISADWIEQIIWEDSTVLINLYCEEIKLSPKYSEEALLNREYEIELHQHYKRKVYWVDMTEIKDNPTK